jgi:hypothetical protein
MTRADDYARSVGLQHGGEASRARLVWAEARAAAIVDSLELIACEFRHWGYVRTACLSVALHAVTGLLRVIAFDMAEMAKREGR